jgi:hypothetical protein
MPKPLPKNDFQDLERLYTEHGDDNMGRLDRKPTRPGWQRLLIFGVILIVAASLLAWAGFYFFGAWQRHTQGDLEVKIEAPEVVSVGEPFKYRLVLENSATTEVQNVRVRVNYPDGFLWKSATLSPEGESHNTWTIASLSPNEPKQIDIEGSLFGEVGTVTTVFSTITYRIPNFRSELEVSTSSATRLDASHVTLTWTAPKQVPPETDAPFSLRYTYDGETTLPDTTLILQVPANMTITKAQPSVETEGQWRWPVTALEKGKTGEISFTGRWANTVTGEQKIKAILQTSAVDDRPLPIVSSEAAVVVSGGDVLLQLGVNGTDRPVAAPGDVLHWRLSYENKGERVLSDVELRVRFDTSNIDFTRVSLPDGGVVEGNAIRWTSATTPALGRIEAHATGEFRWDTPVIQATNTASYAITAAPTLVVHKIDEQAADQTFSGPAVEVAISSPVTVRVEARYFDEQGTPLGDGPLPPRANQSTTYRVRWKISGSVHRLQRVVVSAELPAQVSAVAGSGFASFGTLALGDVRRPKWTIDTVESGLEPSAEFTVKLTPRTEDVGKILVLSGKTTLTATDAETQGTVNAVGPTATTTLDTDAVARGKGVVEP